MASKGVLGELPDKLFLYENAERVFKIGSAS
jgi:hypothetical protein